MTCGVPFSGRRVSESGRDPLCLSLAPDLDDDNPFAVSMKAHVDLSASWLTTRRLIADLSASSRPPLAVSGGGKPCDSEGEDALFLGPG